MTEVHRYNVVTMLSESGGRISYDPHGPEVVMASDYEQLKAERDVLRKDAERYRWLRDRAWLNEKGVDHMMSQDYPGERVND